MANPRRSKPAALAGCAVTAAQDRTPAHVLPTRSDRQPPTDTGLIALTVAETKRLFNLVTRQFQLPEHHLHWT